MGAIERQQAPAGSGWRSRAAGDAAAPNRAEFLYVSAMYCHHHRLAIENERIRGVTRGAVPWTSM